MHDEIAAARRAAMKSPYKPKSQDFATADRRTNEPLGKPWYLSIAGETGVEMVPLAAPRKPIASSHRAIEAEW